MQPIHLLHQFILHTLIRTLIIISTVEGTTMPFISRVRVFLFPSIFFLGLYLGTHLEPTSINPSLISSLTRLQSDREILPDPIWEGPSWVETSLEQEEEPEVNHGLLDLPPISIPLTSMTTEDQEEEGQGMGYIPVMNSDEDVWFDFGDSPFPSSSSSNSEKNGNGKKNDKKIDVKNFIIQKGLIYFSPLSKRIYPVIPKAKNHLSSSALKEKALKDRLRKKLLDNHFHKFSGGKGKKGKEKRPDYPLSKWQDGLSYKKREERLLILSSGKKSEKKEGEDRGHGDDDSNSDEDQDEEEEDGPDVMRDSNGNRLAPHAAEMIRALKENRPFRPAKPKELQELQKKHLEQSQQEDEEEANEEKEEEQEEKEESFIIDDDQKEILNALRAMSPEEREFLSESEKELVRKYEDELESQKEKQRLKLQKEKDGIIPIWAKQQQLIRNRLAGVLGGDHRAKKPERLVKRSHVEPPVVEIVPEKALEDTTSLPVSEQAPVEDTSIRERSESTNDEPAPMQADEGERIPDRPHPIRYLISEAEHKWKKMLRRQSRTLDDAVHEYKKRYKRNPPLGFDSWWRYSMENRVVLVDEYDQINSDITPFFSLSPNDFRDRLDSLIYDDSLPLQETTFSLDVKDGIIERYGIQEASSRAVAAHEHLSTFAEMMPDVTLTFSGHDEPAAPISGEARERHVQFARKNNVLTRAESLQILEDTGLVGWPSLCGTNSTLRRLASSLPIDTAPVAPSFATIDHDMASDVCTHPDLQHENGFTAWDGPRPYLLYPLLSWSKLPVHGDILVPTLDGLSSKFVDKTPWEKKKQNRILWRGSTTGTYHEKASNWRSSQRARLVQLANAIDSEVTVHLADSSSSDVMRHFIAPSRDVNDHYFDIAYEASPTQCDEEDGSCDALRSEYRFERIMTNKDKSEYKYTLNVDGNGPSNSFRQAMLSRSAVLKSTIFVEWWAKRLVPWYHYIPVKSDYSDLHSIAGFFIGSPDGAHSHDQLAKNIGSQGKEWAEKHWRPEDITAYQLRLYLEYARLVNRNSDHSHDFLLN